jgi:hypothetical protein
VCAARRPGRRARRAADTLPLDERGLASLIEALGSQGFGQHPAGACADDLVDQRRVTPPPDGHRHPERD